MEDNSNSCLINEVVNGGGTIILLLVTNLVWKPFICFSSMEVYFHYIIFIQALYVSICFLLSLIHTSGSFFLRNNDFKDKSMNLRIINVNLVELMARKFSTFVIVEPISTLDYGQLWICIWTTTNTTYMIIVSLMDISKMQFISLIRYDGVQRYFI